MGVDFYNCESCGEIYADCGECDQCQGCHKEWCGICMRNGRVEKWIYGGDHYCTLCWKDSPPTPPDDELLEFALDMMKIDRKEFMDAFLKKNPKYLEVPNYFACQECGEDNECANRDCEYVGDEFRPEATDRWGGTIPPERGACCKRQGRTPEEWCDACIRHRCRRVATTLLGLRKFRPASLWAQLPRDVLVHCIIKPRILNRAYWPPPEEDRDGKVKRVK